MMPKADEFGKLIEGKTTCFYPLPADGDLQKIFFAGVG